MEILKKIVRHLAIGIIFSYIFYFFKENITPFEYFEYICDFFEYFGSNRTCFETGRSILISIPIFDFLYYLTYEFILIRRK